MGKEKVAGKGNLFTTMGKVLLVMYILTGILLFILAAVLYKMELSEAAVNISIIISYRHRQARQRARRSGKRRTYSPAF